MVIDAMVAVVVAVFGGLLTLIPAFGGVDLLHDGSLATLGATVGSYVGWLNGYFPVTVLAVCVGFFFAVRAVTTVWWAVVWVYERFPFKAT